MDNGQLIIDNESLPEALKILINSLKSMNPNVKIKVQKVAMGYEMEVSQEIAVKTTTRNPFLALYRSCGIEAIEITIIHKLILEEVKNG